MVAKKTFLGCLFIFSFTASLAQLKPGQIQPSRVPIPSQHYLDEYTFDAPSDPGRWKKEKAGLNVSFASTDESFLRSEVPSLPSQTLSWEDTGWRGERLNAQLLVWSPDTLEQVRITLNDLTNEKGNAIDKSNIDLNMVRYILSNFPYGAKDAMCDAVASDVAYLMPDRFEKFDRFSLPGNSVRPLWISFNIPRDAESGVYSGNIQVRSEKHHATLQIKIKVQQQQLPKPHDWTYRLDLWQNPWVVAWYYHLEPWSAEHKALLKKHLKLYADAGGKYITTYAVHSPWSDNSYMIEGSMIDWRKSRDGAWKFDYNIFDTYVGLAIETGIDKAITIYTPVPWGYRFRYTDESTGNYEYAEWSPESEEFGEVWKIFLDDLKEHLKKKGWLEKTYLGINENPLNITIAAAKFIKAHSKDWKITYAGDWHPELSGLLDDYSPVISSEPSREELAQRKTRGATTTFYVCCTPPQPNNFVFSPPVEGTYISWYAAAYGYDGFLRWAYDAWPADPLRDARHTVWPAGDCFMVYPGGGSSIRFEKLREGIVDFEKIRILKDLASKSPDKKIKKAIEAFDKHLATFIGDFSKRVYNVPEMTAAVRTGKQMLDELSAAMEGL
jgi:hypothetical protein